MAAWNSSEIRLAELRRRWEQSPKSHLFLQLAEEYRRRGDTAQALTVLRQGIEERPSIAAEVALGRCLLDAKDPASAATHLENVVKRDPTQMVAYRHLIEANLQLGNGEEASRCLEIYRQLNARDVDLLVLSERVETLLTPEVQEPLPEAVVELASPAPEAGEQELEERPWSTTPPAPLAEEPANDLAKVSKPSPATGSFSGLWQSEVTEPASEPRRQPGLSDESAPAGVVIEIVKKPNPPVGPTPPDPPVRVPTPSLSLDSLPELASDPLQAGGYLFELPSAPAKNFDLGALPLRALRFPRVPALPPTGGSPAKPASLEPLESPPEFRKGTHVSADREVADLGSAPVDREPSLDLPAPVAEADSTGPTATLGQSYLEQEDAARGSSEVAGQPETVAMRSDVLPAQQERPVTPLDLAELVPLNQVRSSASFEDRRLMVVGAYLNKLKEAKRRVS